MEYRTLGRTGLEVSVLSLGGLFVSKVGGDRAQAFAAIHRALELGVNYVDTAPGYLDSEEVFGEGLPSPHPRPLSLGTALGRGGNGRRRAELPWPAPPKGVQRHGKAQPAHLHD